MKKKLLVIIILLCLILPFKVLAFEFSKGNATSGYEKLSLSKCQITSTSDGGYIIYGKIIDDYGAELKSQVFKFNSIGKMVKSNDQLDKDLKFVVEFKGVEANNCLLSISGFRLGTEITLLKLFSGKYKDVEIGNCVRSEAMFSVGTGILVWITFSCEFK